mmetsp:Transcript_109522/g.315413  ORF Transcript_109522/g.315413 Transcript_109522/m.315413 type:complete len:109 (+) Transcript_109522:863-1189(+)
MSRSIITNEPSTIKDEANWEVLNGNVMDHLVVSTLQKCGVNTAERFQAFARHTSSHANCMLFCNTDVKCTLWESSSENIHTSSTGHGCCDTNNTTIFYRCVDQGIRKN